MTLCAESNPIQLEVRNVKKRYPAQSNFALDDVSLTFRQGSFTALMGPSGCGKTTLLNCATGLDSVDSGNIFLSGRDLSLLTEQETTLVRRENIGFVFQFFNLLSTLTVSENVALPLQLCANLKQKEINQKVDELLELFGLSKKTNHYPSQLSGGEMQRTAIARAIVHKPKIIIADEPTGNLDSTNGIKVLDILKDLSNTRGETIIMATHSNEAARYADIVVHMKDGKISTENLS